MSSKRNANKKAWANRRKAAERTKGNVHPAVRHSHDGVSERVLRALRRPSELDQVGVVIVEEQLGLSATRLEGLRELAAGLPFEP